MKDSEEDIDFSKIFYYDETSPSCLRWAIDIPYKNQKGLTNSMKINKGDIAGSKGKSSPNQGYRWKVKYQQKAYMAHRVVYYLHNGYLDSNLVIDHKDGNPSNNVITNLTLKEQKFNARNVRKNPNNKTGYAGVTFREVNGCSYYTAAWSDLQGKQCNKYFSIAKLGEELALFLAVEYRLHQIDLLNLLGAGYSERHGT